MNPKAFREIAAQCRKRGSFADEPVRAAHCEHVASLLEEIADRMENGGALDSVPASDIWHAISGSTTLTELKSLSLRALRADRPMFSVQFEQHSISVGPSASQGVEECR